MSFQIAVLGRAQHGNQFQPSPRGKSLAESTGILSVVSDELRIACLGADGCFDHMKC